ncbi:MAG: LD-carboxypeptidase [Candidatus Magasanikbacteria bacterium CG11_big_fil_rev_8_21_14_0_20_39_34]|uniref:LD-carboxypeptidase n=1 Tax=Candidatus Magasanikbacteria bacterium CG11_big_fil_rev_8_21_14_0_20_39_34 TaxID=1974653 RepID=A0A2H0N4Z3_9BACT|nr:MAG: LD-carboxypeptidase [Candidatus Magasanikbacteria bacterium CG11_big_fil_rev_8_21_14_0_20_39_34]
MAIKSRKLQKGDTVAVLSPSKGLPFIFPHIFDNGIKILKENFGLKIKEFPTARMSIDKLYGNPKIRAEDINNAFLDKEVKAIFTSIGGDDSIRILEYIDKEVVKNNPKIFMGYSDTTSLTTFFNQLGLVTFNGPSIMAGFSQMANFPESENHIKEILFSNFNDYEYKPFSNWTNSYKDWSKKENTGQVNEIEKNTGWNWIQGESIVTGELFGGCIEIFEMLNGTKYWPKQDFWNDKVLFLETSEEKPSPDYVKYAFRNYGIQGIFDKIKAILIGRARDYTDEEKKQLEKNVVDVISKEFNHPEIPIITNMNFGHTDPQFILPLGIKAEVDCQNKKFKLTESIFEE